MAATNRRPAAGGAKNPAWRRDGGRHPGRRGTPRAGKLLPGGRGAGGSPGGERRRGAARAGGGPAGWRGGSRRAGRWTAALAALRACPRRGAGRQPEHPGPGAGVPGAPGMAGTLDQPRVRAFLDAIDGTDSRPAPGQDTDASGARREPGPAGRRRGPGRHGRHGSAPAGPAGPVARAGPAAGRGTAGTAAGAGPAGTGGNGTSRAARPGPGTAPRRLAGASTMLTIPLATLLGLAERPGDAPALGAIDPALARAAGRQRRPQPPQHLVHHRDRRAGTRHRPRLRQASPHSAKTRTRPETAGTAATPYPGTTRTRDGPAPHLHPRR